MIWKSITVIYLLNSNTEFTINLGNHSSPNYKALSDERFSVNSK